MEIESDAALIKAFKEGRSEFKAITLKEANLSGAHLPFIQLEGAHLPGANLRHACLPGAYLCEAVLERALLEHSNLLGADLIGANLRQAHLDYALLGSANLDGANLNSASLMAVSLAHASLRGANLRNANLIGANLTGANLTEANLFGAKVIHSALQEAHLENTTMPDGACHSAETPPRIQRQRPSPAASQPSGPVEPIDGMEHHSTWATAQREFLIQTLVGKPDAPSAMTNSLLIYYQHSPSDANTLYAFRVEPDSMDLTLCEVRRSSAAWTTLLTG